jgi:hypothetical protein
MAGSAPCGRQILAPRAAKRNGGMRSVVTSSPGATEWIIFVRCGCRKGLGRVFGFQRGAALRCAPSLYHPTKPLRAFARPRFAHLRCLCGIGCADGGFGERSQFYILHPKFKIEMRSLPSTYYRLPCILIFSFDWATGDR